MELDSDVDTHSAAMEGEGVEVEEGGTVEGVEEEDMEEVVVTS